MVDQGMGCKGRHDFPRSAYSQCQFPPILHTMPYYGSADHVHCTPSKRWTNALSDNIYKTAPITVIELEGIDKGLGGATKLSPRQKAAKSPQYCRFMKVFCLISW